LSSTSWLMAITYLMKHFSNRLHRRRPIAGVATQIADNGSPILSDALAYVECSVSNRLECGDHWLSMPLLTMANYYSLMV